MVPSPPRRDAQVRRESAQALPGHLQRQLGVTRLAGAVACAARRDAEVGRLRGEGVPRRQPAHQAIRSSGAWLIEEVHARDRDVDLPRRGVHPSRGDAPPGQDRLQPVLHVLHLEERPVGADRVRVGARLLRRAGVLPPQLLRQHAGHPARVPAARRPARVRGAAGPRRDAQPELRHLLRLRALRERGGARRLRGIPAFGEVRGQEARARRPVAADGRSASTTFDARMPRSSASPTSPSSTPPTRP